MLLFFTFLLTVLPLLAGEKTWNAAGDGEVWSDDDNWLPAVAPTSSDDVVISSINSTATCSETFEAKSITVGGRGQSTLVSEDFIFGSVTPETTSNIGILNRQDGKLVLKGAGTLTVRGQYKDTEESLTSQPSFLFWVE